MLRFLRRNARSWIMYIILGIIIFVFVLYFGSTRDSQGARAIAEIDNVIISEAEFHEEHGKLLEMTRQRYGAKLTPEELKKMDLKKMAYDSLLSRQIIMAKAADLKVQISDEELRNAIMGMPVLQTDGVFDERKYQQLLRYNRTSAEDFESLQKVNMMAGKIEALIRDGIKISDREILDVYTLQNQKINVNYLQIAAKDINKKIVPAESELEIHLKNNSSRFRVAAQLKVKYLSFDGDDYAPAEISEADIRDYYNRNKDKYKTKDGKQIQLQDAQTAVRKELRKMRGMQEAYTVAKKAHDVIYQEENFDAYAAKNKLKVNNLGFFSLNIIPREFSAIKDAALILADLQKDEISRVLATDSGYYVVQVVDKKAAYLPKLTEIKNEVERSLAEQERMAMARQEASAILQRLQQGEEFAKVAREKSLKIQETGFFMPGGDIPKLGSSQEATEALIQLAERKPYPDKPFLINNAYVVFKFKQASQINQKDFEAKKDLYKKIFIAIKRDEILQSWLEGNKEAMKKEGRLKIKKEAKDL